MQKSVLQEKSFSFAVEIVKIYRHLKVDQKEFELARQLLRSGTSIGANIEEALGRQSRKDFASKISIAYKEARETKYWIDLLRATNILKSEIIQTEALLDEILRMLAKTQITLRKQQ